MQNHYVISSKYHFWTRNMSNSTKSPDLVMSGPLCREALTAFYEPLWAVQEDKSWSAKQASFFFLQKLHLSNVRTYS